jgi:hypothetical protein
VWGVEKHAEPVVVVRLAFEGLEIGLDGCGSGFEGGSWGAKLGY